MKSSHFKTLISKNILKGRKQQHSLTSICLKSYLSSLADLREWIKTKMNKWNTIKAVPKIVYLVPKDFIDILFWIILFYISYHLSTYLHRCHHTSSVFIPSFYTIHMVCLKEGHTHTNTTPSCQVGNNFLSSICWQSQCALSTSGELQKEINKII